MQKVTIICPTFDHQDTLYPVMESVKRQTFQDFEVVVIGDGAPPRTKKIMDEISEKDPRFHYRHFPKSERTGEPYRDIIIRECKSDIIAYIADDDLWLPWHLEWVVEALQSADFVHSMHHKVHLDGHIDSLLFQFNSPLLRQRVLNGENRRTFGLSYGAHTRKAYMDLSEGWTTAPKGMPTDLYMWLKFSSDPTVIFWEILYPTALHFTAALRKENPDQRTEELWQKLDDITDQAFVLDLLENVSFLPYFATLCKQTPKHLNSVQEVFDYYDIHTRELSHSQILTTLPENNVLYFRPQSIRLLDIYWKYLIGHTDDLESEQLISDYLKDRPGNNDARLHLAMLHIGAGDFERAEELLQYFEIDTVSSEYIVPLAIVFVKKGKNSDAQKILEVLQSKGLNTSKLQLSMFGVPIPEQ